MKKVFASNDRSAIEILRGLLSAEGIESVVLNEITGAVLGDIPFWHAMPELWISNTGDLERAQAIVADFASGETKKTLPDTPWTCNQCGEEIEGQFTECWNCVLDDPREDKESTCFECGYLLHGLPNRRCPECGTNF